MPQATTATKIAERHRRRVTPQDAQLQKVAAAAPALGGAFAYCRDHAYSADETRALLTKIARAMPWLSGELDALEKSGALEDVSGGISRGPGPSGGAGAGLAGANSGPGGASSLAADTTKPVATLSQQDLEPVEGIGGWGQIGNTLRGAANWTGGSLGALGAGAAEHAVKGTNWLTGQDNASSPWAQGLESARRQYGQMAQAGQHDVTHLGTTNASGRLFDTAQEATRPDTNAILPNAAHYANRVLFNTGQLAAENAPMLRGINMVDDAGRAAIAARQPAGRMLGQAVGGMQGMVESAPISSAYGAGATASELQRVARGIAGNEAHAAPPDPAGQGGQAPAGGQQGPPPPPMPEQAEQEPVRAQQPVPEMTAEEIAQLPPEQLAAQVEEADNLAAGFEDIPDNQKADAARHIFSTKATAWAKQTGNDPQELIRKAAEDGWDAKDVEYAMNNSFEANQVAQEFGIDGLMNWFDGLEPWQQTALMIGVPLTLASGAMKMFGDDGLSTLGMLAGLGVSAAGAFGGNLDDLWGSVSSRLGFGGDDDYGQGGSASASGTADSSPASSPDGALGNLLADQQLDMGEVEQVMGNPQMRRQLFSMPQQQQLEILQNSAPEGSELASRLNQLANSGPIGRMFAKSQYGVSDEELQQLTDLWQQAQQG